MFEVGGVQKIGSFSTMGEKTEKAETQRTVQEMEQHGSSCSWKIERVVLIGTYFKE